MTRTTLWLRPPVPFRTLRRCIGTTFSAATLLARLGVAEAQPVAPAAPSPAPPAGGALAAVSPPKAAPVDGQDSKTATKVEDVAAATAVTGSSTLTLPQVVKVAQERFQLLLAAKAEQDGAEADLLTAEGGFDPSLKSSGAVMATGAYPSQRIDTIIEQPTPLWGTSVFAGYRFGLGKFADYDGKLETNEYGELRGGLRVPVLRDGPIDRRRANIARTELGVEIAKLGLDQQKIEITRISTQRYWDWVGAGRRLSVAQDWLALAEQRNIDITTRVTKGDLPEIEQLENERSLLSRRAAVISAKRQVEQAAIELSLFFRKVDGSPNVPSKDQLPESLPDPPVVAAVEPTADAQTDALARRPEPKRAEAVKAQAKVELDLARNQALPAIDLFVVGSADLGPGDEKRGIPVVEAGVVIDIPLLFRPQRGRVKSQEAAVRRADKQAEFARDRVGAEVKDSRSAKDAAAKRAEVAAQEVTLAEKLEVLEKKRFDLGDSTMLIVNLREQATLEARLRRIDALVDYQKAVAAERAAKGLSTPQ